MVFTVVHHYFKRNYYQQDKKRLQKILYLSGFPDARSIRLPSSYLWKDMGNSVTPQAKDPGLDKEDVVAQTYSEVKSDGRVFQLSSFKSANQTGCCTRLFDIFYALLCIVTMLTSLSEIILTICTAISTKLFSSEQSGRLVGMVLLALLAAVTISILVYALIAVFKKQQKPLHAAAVVLLVVAILQGVVIGLAVRMTNEEEVVLFRSLEESLKLAKEENSRHIQLWASTQNELTCCGLYGPDDYPPQNLPKLFGPDVPISCCVNYDSSRSDLVQEREREACKATKNYYRVGCMKPVVDSVKSAAELVVALTCSLIALEIILAILALILLNKVRQFKSKRSEEKENNA